MSSDLGPLNLGVAPVLERISREDRLQDDQPGKQKQFRSKLVRKPTGTPPDDAEGEDDSMSSNRIDLRV